MNRQKKGGILLAAFSILFFFGLNGMMEEYNTPPFAPAGSWEDLNDEGSLEDQPNSINFPKTKEEALLQKKLRELQKRKTHNQGLEFKLARTKIDLISYQNAIEHFNKKQQARIDQAVFSNVSNRVMKSKRLNTYLENEQKKTEFFQRYLPAPIRPRGRMILISRIYQNIAKTCTNKKSSRIVN